MKSWVESSGFFFNMIIDQMKMFSKIFVMIYLSREVLNLLLKLFIRLQHYFENAIVRRFESLTEVQYLGSFL